MIVLGLFGSAIFSALLPLSVYCKPDFGKVMVVTSYALFGVAMMLIAVNGVPFLANSAPTAIRTHVFAAYGATAPAGQFLGSVVGGLTPNLLATTAGLSLDTPQPYGFSLWVVPIVMFVFGVVFLRTGHPDDTVAAKARSVPASARPGGGKAPWRLCLVFSASTVLRDAAPFAIGTFFSLYLDVTFMVRVTIIGIILALSRVIPAIAVTLAPALIRRLGSFRLIVFLSIAQAVAMLPAGLIAGVAAVTASLVVITSLNVILGAVFSSYSQEASPREWRPLTNGFVGAADAVAMIIAAYGGGLVVQSMGFRPLFLLVVALALLSAPVFWLPLRKMRTVPLEAAAVGS